MSAKRMAASTPSRRTGWRVTSAHSAASRVISMERRPLADRAVLGQRATGLAHEPDRGRVDRQLSAGAKEAGVAVVAHARNAARAASSVCVDLGVAVGQPDEPRLELRRREQDPGVEHRPEEARERRRGRR